MSISATADKPPTISRVVYEARGRRMARSLGRFDSERFETGDTVRSLTEVKNDGISPHKDIGEILVNQGDTGVVRDSWSFLGESYYTVEFAARAACVIMSGREMSRAAHRRTRRAWF